MKKILSIFMVAVLSLNLLHQPCEAMNMPQRSGHYQQYQQMANYRQGKVGCVKRIFNFVKTAVKVVFVISACLAGFVGFCAGVAVGGAADCEYKMPDRFPSEKMSDKCQKNINDFLASSECSSDLMNFFDEFAKSYYEVKE